MHASDAVGFSTPSYTQTAPYYWYYFPAPGVCPICGRPYDTHIIPWPGYPYSFPIITVPGA